MKAKLMLFLGCLLISGFTYACGCESRESACGFSVNKCECTDPNYDSNPCMSISEYCEVYGNIAGLDKYP